MRRGFTLVEVLIAIGIFTLVSVISSNILVDVFRLEQKTEIENAVMEDIRLMMQTLTNEIQNGTIDYEEYYSQHVLQEEDRVYGINYGVYASRFYDPGESSQGDSENPRDLGIECSLEGEGECVVYWTPSRDINVGKHPFDGDEHTTINAFCDFDKGICDEDNENRTGRSVTVEELYLLDKTGTRKTILAKKLIQGDNHHAIGLMRMVGRDYDQNGVVDIFTCPKEFKCGDPGNRIKYPFATNEFIVNNDIKVAEHSDLNQPFDPNNSQFVPITPLRSNVKKMEFTITPNADPYKAFDEAFSQIHPTVTILLEVGLSPEAARNYPGEFRDITVQTTVAAGVKERIKSYPPVRDTLRMFGEGGSSWISDVLPQ